MPTRRRRELKSGPSAVLALGMFSWSWDLRPPISNKEGFCEALRGVLGESASVRSLEPRTTLEIRDLDCLTTEAVSYTHLLRALLPCRGLEPRPPISYKLQIRPYILSLQRWCQTGENRVVLQLPLILEAGLAHHSILRNSPNCLGDSLGSR